MSLGRRSAELPGRRFLHIRAISLDFGREAASTGRGQVTYISSLGRQSRRFELQDDDVMDGHLGRCLFPMDFG